MPVEIVMPRLSDTMDRGTIAKWNKKPGEAVHRGDVLVEIETDKANMELESYSEGVLAKILAPEGATADVGAPIGIVAADKAEMESLGKGSEAGDDKNGLSTAPASTESIRPETKQVVASQPERNGVQANGRVKASPLARRLARERGVDLADVAGTGPGGRIVRDDVMDSHAVERGTQPQGGPGEIRRHPSLEAGDVQLSKMQLAVGRRLSESVLTAPHFYVTAEIDMTDAVALRRQLNEAKPEWKVSFNDMVVKGAGLALTKFPNINASFHEGKLIRHGAIDIGIAVDLAEGLIVPVIRGVDQAPLQEVAFDARRLVEAAREGLLKQQQLEGGTFTVSNLGMFGVDEFTAIINPPQSAILAVGAIHEKAVVVDGTIAIRSRLRVTLSCDHRVVYGAQAAAFLAELRRILERPVLLLI